MQHQSHHDNHDMQHDSPDMHHDMSHGGFMSMVMMTKDLPRSQDGLRMEDNEVQFGPEHPAVAPGVVLVLTLDGDSVRCARIEGDASIATDGGVQEQFAWAVRFFDIIGHQKLLQLVRRAQQEYEQHNVPVARQLLHRIYAAVNKSRLIRWRLNGLASYKGDDAYDRLIKGLRGIEKSLDGVEVPVQLATGSIITHSLEGLELSQALVAAASFPRLVPSEDKHL